MKERRCKTAQCLRDARGFTLVELILTIAILAIVTIPILSYFTDAAKHNARSRQKQNATVLATIWMTRMLYVLRIRTGQ